MPAEGIKTSSIVVEKSPASNQAGKNNGSKRRSKPKKSQGKNKITFDKFTFQIGEKKDRKKELERISDSLKLGIADLTDKLRKHRDGMEKSNPEKTKYLDWILDITSNGDTDTKGIHPDKKKRKDVHVNNLEKDSTPKKKREKQDNDSVDSAEIAEKDPAKESMLTDCKFADRSDIHKLSKKAIANVLKLERMSQIQKETYEAASKGKDVLGRARTGTGKTMAFLLPAVERLLDSTSEYESGKGIGVLVLSPTRELAIQIGEQAKKLLTYHKDLSVQTVYGGSKITKDISQFNKCLPSILVATPGRLLDHAENTSLSKGKSFKNILSSTQLLILDETDRLLDMGFRREIKKIMAYLPPKEERQTLLFSATIPEELREILRENMRPKYVDVDCIGTGGGDGGAVASAHTNARVNQSHVILPNMDRYVSSVVEIVTSIMQDKKDGNVKVVVFFPTARMVGFFAEFFNDALGIEVIELHSRKSQTYRNKASEKFRVAKQAVLFTSDVSARGVDYPDVSNVIQFGIPESREQYIHRLGRTGRAGKTGKGLLVLAPFEQKFLRELEGLDIPEDEGTRKLLSSPPSQKVAEKINDGMANIDGPGCNKDLTKSAKMAYSAFLGYYLGQTKRTHIKNKGEIVTIANDLSKIMGLSKPPSLPKRTVGKMGLKGVAGITIEASESFSGGQRGRR
eukprot:CAMPEP_0194144574 /NCGR_PEP_ID=MMETSP0152-20130528/13613_1 /TAXON_ID=1049557 /ORGANISM="Thalassiothrix antarctica, Strain L6-D1" /LENGTH=683 /DNA_ID=CAMNT_0038844493 /DNA_START=151 /DNA_END=2202 /DNA_ORIENTATION=-